jgi:hypothetical protein
LRDILASENDGVASEGLASFVAGKQPVRWSLPAKVATEQFQQFGWQQGLPALAPFAAANLDHISAAIDVRYFGVRYLRDPRTGSIHGGQNRSVAKVFRASRSALTSSRLMMIGSFLSYLGKGMRSMPIWRAACWYTGSAAR